jgi:glucose dehydrogenase
MNRKWDQLIAWSELLGGLAGLVVLLPVTAIQRVALLGPMYYLGAGLGFLAALVAGVLLLRRKQFGRELSLVVQLLQVVQLTALGWKIQYATGIQALIKIGPGTFQLSPGVNAAVWFAPPLVPAHWAIGVNMFALWAAIYLARGIVKQRARDEHAVLDARKPQLSAVSHGPA